MFFLFTANVIYDLTIYDVLLLSLIHIYLQGQAVADVAGEADVQACTLEDVINERGGCSLSVRAGDTDHLCAVSYTHLEEIAYQSAHADAAGTDEINGANGFKPHPLPLPRREGR